jgi:hypothetical protein
MKPYFAFALAALGASLAAFIASRRNKLAEDKNSDKSVDAAGNAGSKIGGLIGNGPVLSGYNTENSNNPGNVIYYGGPGQVGQWYNPGDSHYYAVYDTINNGLNAALLAFKQNMQRNGYRVADALYHYVGPNVAKGYVSDVRASYGADGTPNGNWKSAFSTLIRWESGKTFSDETMNSLDYTA